MQCLFQATRGVVLLWVPIVLSSRIHSASSILLVSRHGIIGNPLQIILCLSSNVHACRISLPFVSIDTSSTVSCDRREGITGTASIRCAVIISLTRANIDGPAIGRIPVAFYWWLIGKRQICLAFVDQLFLGLRHVDVADVPLVSASIPYLTIPSSWRKARDKADKAEAFRRCERESLHLRTVVKFLL